MAHLTHDNAGLVARIRRIGGQIASVEKALTSDEPCATVLHRLAAVRGALNGLMDEVITNHLDEHVAKPGLTDAERAEAAAELKTVIRRYAR